MSRSQSLTPVAAAVLVALVLVLPGLGGAPLDDPGEGQHAEIAREISADGGWVTLRLNGVRYFDKPPLLYWLTAASFRLFGPSEWAARLAPLLGAVLAAAGTAVLGARLLGLRGGVIAAGALLSSALFVAFGRYVRPETLFVAAIQWGFTGLLLGLRDAPASARRRPSAWPLVGAAALGVALLVTLGFGWYLVAALRDAGFLWYTVVDNHLLNALGLRHFPDEDVPLSTLEFLAVSGLGAFPWIIPAVLAMGSLARRRA